MWLLNWLLDKANLVLELFGSLYGAVKNAALNAYRWAQEAASSALASARGYASGLYTQAVNVASSLFNQALSNARSLFDQAKTLIGNTLSAAITAAGQLVVIAKYELMKLIDAAAVAASQLVQIAEYYLIGLINKAAVAAGQLVAILEIKVVGMLNDAAIAAKQLVDLSGLAVKAITDGISKEVQDLKEAVGADKPETKGTLLSFLTDPIAFLAAYVASFLLAMLFDLLGHGLGSLKYDLPPPIVWGPGGSGGPYPPGPGPGPGASGLSAPISPLYISGYRYGPSHPGVDLGLAMGQPVYAMHAGTARDASTDNQGYGNWVDVSGDPWWSRYGHLAGFAVQSGQPVSQGQLIGFGDSVGNSTGPHLHLEIKYQGQYIDPVTVLPL